MNITSNLTSIKNFISELPRTNFGNLGGRVVTFIKDYSLSIAGIGAVVAAIFFIIRWRAKPEDGAIIGTKLNYEKPLPDKFDRRETPLSESHVRGQMYLGTSGLSNGKVNEFVVVSKPRNDRSIPVKYLNPIVINYTTHSINLDKAGHLLLDGFNITNEPLNIDFKMFNDVRTIISLYPIEKRPDLICMENIYGYPTIRKIIVLDKVKNHFVISWITDAKNFGHLSDQLGEFVFKFKVPKIDEACHTKKVFELLFMSHSNDTGSIFATIPWDILNHIVKSL